MTKITQKPDGTVIFELIIPKEIIAKEYEHALKEVAKTTTINGFRPGKAPIKLVEAQTDKSQLLSHVLDHVLSPTYSQVIHEHRLVPLIEPRVNPKSMEDGKDWVMSVQVATTPELKLGDYEKLISGALKKHATARPHNSKSDAGEDHKESEKDHKLNVIFDSLLDGIKFEVAPLLIHAETESALSRLSQQLSSLKISIADYAKSIKKSTEDLVKEYQKSAESNLKLEFILQKLIELKKPKVTDAELAELKPQKGQEGYAKYVIQKRKILDILGEL